jgi:hypothetical protein
MEELKILIEMVSHLPTMMVWVLVGYLIYKVSIIGSIYGVIRLLIVKLHDWAVKPKEEIVTQSLGGLMPISHLVDPKDICIQLGRLRDKGNPTFLKEDLEKLNSIIDNYFKFSLDAGLKDKVVDAKSLIEQLNRIQPYNGQISQRTIWHLTSAIDDYLKKRTEAKQPL